MKRLFWIFAVLFAIVATPANAATTGVTVSPGKFTLDHSVHTGQTLQVPQQIRVKNESDAKETITIQPSGYIQASTNTLTLAPGESTAFDISLSIPKSTALGTRKDHITITAKGADPKNNVAVQADLTYTIDQQTILGTLMENKIAFGFACVGGILLLSFLFLWLKERGFSRKRYMYY